MIHFKAQGPHKSDSTLRLAKLHLTLSEVSVTKFSALIIKPDNLGRGRSPAVVKLQFSQAVVKLFFLYFFSDVSQK